MCDFVCLFVILPLLNIVLGFLIYYWKLFIQFLVFHILGNPLPE